MATATQIRTAIDTKLTQLWPAIQAHQDAYAANHASRYWQGLTSHSVLPADGAETTPDIGTRTPTDQPVAWPVALRTTTMPMSLQLDVYDGPQGTGYVATARVTIAGQTWQRSAQVGPETWRTQAWTAVIRTELG